MVRTSLVPSGVLGVLQSAVLGRIGRENARPLPLGRQRLPWPATVAKPWVGVWLSQQTGPAPHRLQTD